MPIDRDVPMLLRDPVTTLLHLLMQLPMHVDVAYFTSIVQGIYNLVYIEILCKLSNSMRESERNYWKTKSGVQPDTTLKSVFLLGTVIRYLEKSPLYLSDADLGDMDLENQDSVEPSEDELEHLIQSYLLPFLRIASLLRHHIYEQQLPEIHSFDQEFSKLTTFLNLGTSNNDDLSGLISPPMSPFASTSHSQPSSSIGLRNRITSNSSKAHDLLHWISPTPLTAIYTWCEDLCGFISRAQVSSRYLIQSQHVLWSQPRLMELPEAYDVIFQYYHRKQCPNCNTVPKEPTICLVCGTMVCLRDVCCKHPTTGVCEAIQHSIDCGAGTVMYLSVNSSTIVVVRGRRACLWGSVYLDAFGEEDRELKYVPI